MVEFFFILDSIFFLHSFVIFILFRVVESVFEAYCSIFIAYIMYSESDGREKAYVSAWRHINFIYRTFSIGFLSLFEFDVLENLRVFFFIITCFMCFISIKFYSSTKHLFTVYDAMATKPQKVYFDFIKCEILRCGGSAFRFSRFNPSHALHSFVLILSPCINSFPRFLLSFFSPGYPHLISMFTSSQKGNY